MISLHKYIDQPQSVPSWINISISLWNSEFLTWSLFSVGFERRDDDFSDLSHTHAQQALIHALDHPTLTY